MMTHIRFGQLGIAANNLCAGVQHTASNGAAFAVQRPCQTQSSTTS
jgi:hypothetical protein